MLYSLLAEETTEKGGFSWPIIVIFAVMIIGVIVLMVLTGNRNKKQAEESKKLIDAVKPGNKVKTIGGICGIVVEIDDEENTFVLETGTEQSGKCFIKFDKQAIYQTDAVVAKEEAKPAEESETEPESEAPATEEAPQEDVPVEKE